MKGTYQIRSKNIPSKSRTRKSWKGEEVTSVAEHSAAEEENDDGEKEKKWKLVVNRHWN